MPAEPARTQPADAAPTNTEQHDLTLPTPASHPPLDQLIAVLEHLRAPGGCAWDAEQTHESLAKYLIEESHELVDAIENGTRDDLLEELGDVLYQVLFHADIAAAHPDAPFTIEDIAARTTAKMVGRHPHVFGDVTADTADEVSANWDTWKAQEKPTRTSVLDGLPAGLPSLARADKVLSKAAGVGVDPAHPGAAAPRASDGSVGHAAPASATPADAALTDEATLGRHILALVADARRRGLDADRAVRGAVRELEERIRAAEQRIPAASPE